MVCFKLQNENATMAFGERLAPLLRRGDIVRLVGDLGAGKSTLARGLVRALTEVTDAPSPTFTFVETYETAAFLLWHFDLYRLDEPEDVWELGLEEALDDGVCLIEWPEKAGALLSAEGLTIRLGMDGDGRRIQLDADDDWRDRLSGAGIA